MLAHYHLFSCIFLVLHVTFLLAFLTFVHPRWMLAVPCPLSVSHFFLLFFCYLAILLLPYATKFMMFAFVLCTIDIKVQLGEKRNECHI